MATVVIPQRVIPGTWTLALGAGAAQRKWGPQRCQLGFNSGDSCPLSNRFQDGMAAWGRVPLLPEGSKCQVAP